MKHHSCFQHENKCPQLGFNFPETLSLMHDLLAYRPSGQNNYNAGNVQALYTQFNVILT